LKLRFYETSPREVTAECTITEEYQGYPGVVHGGVVAAMLDELAGRSLMGGDTPRFMYTARLEIRYRKNVPIGQPLHLVGTALSTKKRTATAKSAIYALDGSLLAEADVLLVNIPTDVIQSVDLAALGWRIYAESE
jgi:acyl-coenzyme A thioesterase PaaI-like protein